MSTPPELPEAVVVPRKRWRFQLVWLVPVVAVLVGIWLAAKAVLEQGPTVTITFKTGEGLEPGKTKIKFKDVDIGLVKTVALSRDHKRVIATAELTRDASDMLVDDTRFWVVRPRISGGTVSGISTLLSGAYIGMDMGRSNKDRRDYVGLEQAPIFASDVPGREFVLRSPNLGSVDIGTPVYYRRLGVGQVTSFELDPDGGAVTLHVFVNAPYDRFVSTDSRFWEASGVDLSLGSDGLKVNTQSFVSILVGGLAFETPQPAQGKPASAADKPTATPPEAPAKTTFVLYESRADAMREREKIVETYAFNFHGSVRGLAIGAPVDFRGITVGEVSAIYTRFDPQTKEISIPVEVKFYPERFTSRYAEQPKGGRVTNQPRALADLLVARGLRAQLRTGSIITGQMYIALDFFPSATHASIDWSRTPPELPTTPGGLQSLQDSAARLIARLDKLPIEEIGANAKQTLQNTTALTQNLNTLIIPQAANTLAAARGALNSANQALQPDSVLQSDTTEAVRELTRTAASFRVLADYLQQHPEALLRGKPEDSK
jgi:paraquat-inducible protein B